MECRVVASHTAASPREARTRLPPPAPDSCPPAREMPDPAAGGAGGSGRCARGWLPKKLAARTSAQCLGLLLRPARVLAPTPRLTTWM